MRTLSPLVPALLLVVALAGCGGSTEPDDDPVASPTPTATASPTAEPTPSPTPAVATASVVFVAEDDQLNVRAEPGPQSEVVGTLDPTATGIELTDNEEIVDGDRWVEISAPTEGWVNATFLTTTAPDVELDEAAAAAFADEVAAVLAGDSEWSSVVADDELWVSHHDDPRRFTDLSDLLDDDTEYDWGGTGCSPEECPDETFREAIADPFVSTVTDDDREVAVNEPIPGPNGRLPETLPPTPYRNLPYIAVHDPGDDPQYDGLDWQTWYVHLEFVDGEPRLVGLSVDEYAP